MQKRFQDGCEQGSLQIPKGDQRVQIEGELVQFQFRNPHSFVHVMVKEKDGSVVRYGVEWGAPTNSAERV